MRIDGLCRFNNFETDGASMVFVDRRVSGQRSSFMHACALRINLVRSSQLEDSAMAFFMGDPVRHTVVELQRVGAFLVSADVWTEVLYNMCPIGPSALSQAVGWRLV